MKRYLVPVLIALNAVLALSLLALWVDGQGKLRNVQWLRPAAIRPDFSTGAAPLARQGSDDVGKMVATLARPLFSPSRRPPPVILAAPAPPPDPLANIQLYGVFSGPGGGGIIARVDGKMRRANVSDRIGEWTLRKIADRDVTFVRGAESRVIVLARGKKPASATPSTPVATPQDAQLQMSGAQRIQESERERLRQINETNVRNGLPPITHR